MKQRTTAKQTRMQEQDHLGLERLIFFSVGIWPRYPSYAVSFLVIGM